MGDTGNFSDVDEMVVALNVKPGVTVSANAFTFAKTGRMTMGENSTLNCLGQNSAFRITGNVSTYDGNGQGYIENCTMEISGGSFSCKV